MTRDGLPAACCGRWTRCGSFSPSMGSSRPTTGPSGPCGLASCGASGPWGRPVPRAIAGWSGSCRSKKPVVSRPEPPMTVLVDAVSSFFHGQPARSLLDQRGGEHLFSPTVSAQVSCGGLHHAAQRHRAHPHSRSRDPLVALLATEAQRPMTVPRIGYLDSRSPADAGGSQEAWRP